MFDLRKFLLKEVPEAHMPPATGHTTERGEVWKDAVDKINAALLHIQERGETLMEAAAKVTEHVGDGLKQWVTESFVSNTTFGERTADLEDRIKALEAKIEAVLTPGTPPVDPSLPPTEDEVAES